MPTLTAHLKQHTPILHFQAHEKGATLRATEVKPKLDRFLLRKLGGGDMEKGREEARKEGWLIKDNSLSYKISIHSKGICTCDPGRIAKGFFGNIGNSQNKKKLLTAQETKMNIFCFNEKLKNFIDKHLGDFFLSHNFGTRQNRGYGSFTRENSEKNKPDEAEYHFTFKRGMYKSISSEDLGLQALEAIDWLYKSLRQGINLYGYNSQKVMYMKPMIFLYAKSKGITWEKGAIKEKFWKDNILRNQKNKYCRQNNESPVCFSSKRHHLVRDLFGLSSSEYWKYPYRATIKKEDKEEDKKNKIERHPSPLMFKVIKVNENCVKIFFWNKGISDKYKKSTFEIIKEDKKNENKDKGESEGKKNKDSLELKIWEDFNMQDFFKFAFFEADLKSCITTYNEKGRKIEKLLTTIYQEIKSNYKKKQQLQQS